MKIMVVGPTKSGKTCLAVGLANSKNDEIVVSTRGVGQYLRERAKEFAESKWPGGTKERTSLGFVFKWNEKTVDTIIDDCIGESSTSTKFLEEMSELGEDDGVVLLVNPGFDCPYIDESGKTRIATDEDEKAGKKIFCAKAFKDDRPFARQWLIDQEGKYEQIIESLRTKRNGGSKGNDLPVVAVVVTASDRLEPNGDLYAHREHFNAFLAKVTNRLTGFKHKTFSVSVTGHLEDQNKPTLASGKENTSYRPFRWVLEKLAERKEEKIKGGDQSELKNRWKSVLIIASVVAAVAGLCIGTFKWVDAVRDQEDIATWMSAIVSSLGKTSLRCGDIENASGNLNRLRRYNGFYEAEAAMAADRWEPEIWKKQKSLISKSILEISDSQGKKGSDTDVAEVDKLFSAFNPTMTNVVAEYDKVYENWNRQKVGLQELHKEYEFRENVEKPLRAAEKVHGIYAMDKLYPITDTIRSLKPSTERLNLAKEGLARKVDGQIEDEWRNFAIRGFEKTASTNATTEAVEDFQARLDDWTPVSSSGIVAKSNLVAFVSTNVPVWRTQYETTKFISEAEKAVKKNSMEDMAIFYPGRVATNEFLTVEFAEKQWKSRVKPVFERERKAYLDGIVAKSSDGRNRPTFADGDKNDIKRRATSVGEPFYEANALKYVEEQVESKSKIWETAKREECNKWIREKIRPGRSRTDRKGLWSEYEKDPVRWSNPWFIKIVGKAVYREVEKWFESDVAAFKKELSPAEGEGVSLWLDDSNFEVRYKGLVNTFEEFKKTCRHINEDKNPPAGTWAHRFAELCVTKGGIDSCGVNRVFGQRIVAKQLDARIDYQKKFPVNYKCTAFAAWFEVESFEGNGTPMKGDDNLPNPQLISLIDADGKHAPREEKNSIGEAGEGEYKTIWSDEKILEAGLFQRTKFVVKATDYNGNRIEKTSDIKKVISFVDKQRTLELDGQLHIGRLTGVKDADIKVRLTVDISGETPFSLLEQAKQEIRERGDAK